MDKKQEILLAANECFLKYGYSKTSMSDIGKMVHLNKASLYYHYKDKLTLYKEVVMMHRNKYLLELQELLKLQPSSKEKILLFIEREVRFSQQTSLILTNSNNNIYDTKLETKSVYDAIVASDVTLLEGLIQEGVDRSEFSSCHPKEIASLIMKTTDALLNVNCPLFLEENQRTLRYQELSEDIRLMIILLLTGLTAPTQS